MLKDFVSCLLLGRGASMCQGVSWMVYNWSQGRGSILADEMGLGKTLQVSKDLMTLMEDPPVLLYGLQTEFYLKRRASELVMDGWCMVYLARKGRS